ncbi:MAG TPA: nicotinate-nucleotide adenylyltransferase [Rhizomicrobium sp.]
MSHWVTAPGPIAPGLRIGLLGGSFNPAHGGHLYASLMAMRQLDLDYVWWLVTPRNPLKPASELEPLKERLCEACHQAKHPRIAVMDIESRLRTHYTIDTVSALQRRFPQVHFVWLMGSDNLAQFRRWRRWPDIAARIPIAVIQRPGTTMAQIQAKAIQRFGRRRVARGLALMRPPAIAILDGARSKESASALRQAAWAREALVHAIPTC